MSSAGNHGKGPGPIQRSGRSRQRFYEDERAVIRAWETFLGGRPFADSSKVRELVQLSWGRSHASGVDPGGRGAPLAFEGDAVEDLREHYRRLRDAATPTLTRASELLVDTNSMVILTDHNGVILEAVGDPSTVDAGREIHLEVGGNWNESAAGTNGIGTALALKRPVFVHAAEHFSEGIKSWTCAGAPIRDPVDGQVMGLIDISGPKKIFQRHNLALSVVAAQRIESCLAEQSASERVRLLEACLSMLPAFGEDGIVALDRAGRVVHCNEKVSGLLESWAIPLRPSIGQRLLPLNQDADPRDWAQLFAQGVKRDWLQPINIGNDSIGTLLVIPSRRHKATPRASAVNKKTIAPASPSDIKIVGECPALKAAIEKAERVARSRTAVLIVGETGVGKELIANLLYRVGRQREQEPFIIVNSGAMSKELLASELFGYVRGAFTGAAEKGRAGRFESADGGSLCLDEIGEMPLDVQPYLLRVLEEGVVCRLGENQPRKVDVRLVAMTNRNLQDEISLGHFRQDLFYRISAVTISIPPLRERGGDIDLLIDHFNHEFAERYAVEPLVFDSAARAALQKHSWPGNVRELRNVVEGLILTSSGGQVALTDLPDEIVFSKTVAGIAPSAQADGLAPQGTEERRGPPIALEDAERRAILDAITACGGKLSEAARALGISRSTLYRKMKHYDLQRP